MTLQKKRLAYHPAVPLILRDVKNVHLRKVSEKRTGANNSLSSIFPKTWDQVSYELAKGEKAQKTLCVGVFFSGGQAPGGHNVIAGIWDAIQKIDPDSQLIGFLGGPSGCVEKKYCSLTAEQIDQVRNMGGFDLLGSGRTKIETTEQMAASKKTCEDLGLDGLVVIGGDDSNTNAAILAEYFLAQKCQTKVIGVPKTIDGDLQNEDIEISFGFDSACKTYSEMIGNIGRDALSAKKYYHFIKLMGRSASHITLECAFATQPNLALIGEERKSLKEVVSQIVDLISRRKKAGKEYGVILIPEGMIDFMPEMHVLIEELNRGAPEKLSKESKNLFFQLPEKIQKQLVLDRDPHGNVALSQIETESLLIELVRKEIDFSPVAHFFGYEGRACFPSNFDANYCYSLGLLAALGVRDGASGMICALRNLAQKTDKWIPSLVPIVQLMGMEERKGKQKPVIQKALVDIRGKAFTRFAKMRKAWEMGDSYLSPGPMQFFGDSELVDSVPCILISKSS